MSQPDRDAEYVGFPDPVGVRRPLLEAAKAAVETGRAYERIQAIQDRKLETRTALAKVLGELRESTAKLQTVLPRRDIKDTPTVLPAPKKKVLDHRLDKIESALAEIEQRMKTL
jgi:hypothetical protein